MSGLDEPPCDRHALLKRKHPPLKSSSVVCYVQVLERRIKETGMEVEAYKAYLDLRRYGNVPHSGFGLGFERLIMFATGIENIREVIPFPRWVRKCEY